MFLIKVYYKFFSSQTDFLLIIQGSIQTVIQSQKNQPSLQV